MTRDEKISVIMQGFQSLNRNDYFHEQAERLLDAIEERSASTFRQNEIVSRDAQSIVNGVSLRAYRRFGDISHTSNRYEKLSPAEVAATVNGTYGPYNFYVVTESGFTLSKDKPMKDASGKWYYGTTWISLPKCPEWKPCEGAIE